MAEQRYTAEQLRVISHEGRHAVVSAVAGSGKTETLIGRVRHLLRDTSPHRIAVVMFNRDAAVAFKKRFEQSVGGTAPEIRTFNSMGNKILNRLVELGHLPEARISEKDHDRRKLAKNALTTRFRAEHGPAEAPDKELLDDFLGFIGLVKSDIRNEDNVFERGGYQQAARIFPDAFRLYEDARKAAKVRFFDDQLYDPTKKLLADPALQSLVANRIDHLIIDEAQDVNGVQIALMRILAGTRAAVMIVGDEDQAIYEWRGANPDYITRGFEADFPGCTRYTLPHTFRFGHVLSLAASQLISLNANRNPKISISAPGTPPTQIHTIGLPTTSPAFGKHIQAAIDRGISPDQIAVLVRTYSLTFSLELELHQLRIPYFVYGRPSLLRIPEISSLMAVLQLAVGRWKELAEDDAQFMFRSLLSMPTLYLPAETLNRLTDAALEAPGSLSEIVRSAAVPSMARYQVEQISDRADLLHIIATATSPESSPSSLLNLYLKGTRFDEAVRKQSATPDQADARLLNVKAFVQIAALHEGSIAEFLDELDPLMASAAENPPKEPHVWIGSIHRAKGAQWPVVFIPGLAAGGFPRRDMLIEQQEAERRLCYVAITRAIDELFLIHPVDPEFSTAVNDIRPELRPGLHAPTSEFLWEMEIAVARHADRALANGEFTSKKVARPSIPNGYLAHFPGAAGWKFEPWHPPHPAAVPVASTSQDGLAPGERVRHPVFGDGVVEVWIDARVVKLRFADGSTRMFVASMTPLTPL